MDISTRNQEAPTFMKRIPRILVVAVAGAALSASAALAVGPEGNHGADVSAVAKAVDYVTGQARGAAVSAVAKTHGAEVSAAARVKAAAAAAAGKAKGEAAAAAGAANGAAAAANGAAMSEPGRLKAEAAAAAGQAHQPQP